MLTTPITGAAVTGLTSPAYVLSVDVPPNSNSKQWAITGITGTQPSVDAGSTPARPWTYTFSRPANIRQLNAVDQNNVLRSVPMNVYTSLLRKGLTVLSGQPSKTGSIRTEYTIPAGADTADVANIKAMFSCWAGGQTQAINNLVNLATTGVMA